MNSQHYIYRKFNTITIIISFFIDNIEHSCPNNFITIWGFGHLSTYSDEKKILWCE